MGPGLILPFTIEQMSCPAIVGQKMQGRPSILPALFLICQAGLRGKPTGAAFCFPLYFHSCPFIQRKLLLLILLEMKLWREHTLKIRPAKRKREKRQHPRLGIVYINEGFSLPLGLSARPTETRGGAQPQAGRQANSKAEEGLEKV